MGSTVFLTISEFLQSVSDLYLYLATLTVGAFLLAAILELTDRVSIAVPIAGVGWVIFGLFWLSMFPYYYYDVQSPLQAVLSFAGVPIAWYTGYVLASGRTTLLSVSRAISIMGLIYLTATAVDPLRILLIETVAVKTHFGMELLGYSPGITEGPNGYMSRFDFDGYTTYIVLACTGIGSISVFAGLIASVSAPLKRKVVGIAVVTTVIWALNLLRNIFIGLASPLGWFDYSIFHTITGIFAEGVRTSYFISHHLISQSLSVGVLLLITLFTVRLVPETLEPLEEVLYVLTGNEYDLEDAFGQPIRTDGGD